MALAEKGVHAGSHYDLAPKAESTHITMSSNGTTAASQAGTVSDNEPGEDDGGVHL
jgi:hypothetical protein